LAQYVTIDDFRRFNSDISINERAFVEAKARQRSPNGSTFLSHSSQDAEFLPGIIELLENHGGEVYIDKKDTALPPYTSRETAQILRGRIAECKKFILLATTNSKDSKWMPWELGIADGLKHQQCTAILPGVDSRFDTSWTEQEYLGIYDRIVWGSLKGYSSEVWMVLNQEKNTATTLSKWLRS
jgi:hypothetical protein